MSKQQKAKRGKRLTVQGGMECVRGGDEQNGRVGVMWRNLVQ